MPYARRVVLATDAYTDHLWLAVAQSSTSTCLVRRSPAVVRRGGRGHHAAARRGIRGTQDHLLLSDRPGQPVVIGGRGRSMTHQDDKTREQLRHAAIARFHALARVSWDYGWACCVGMTIDDLPRRHELAPGVFTAYGYFGRSVGMGTVPGRILAQAVRDMPLQDLYFPVTPAARLPFYPLKQWGTSVAIQYNTIASATR